MEEDKLKRIHKNIHLPQRISFTKDGSSDESNKFLIPKFIQDELRKIFDEISIEGIADPEKLKMGLKSVDFHKESPQLFKIIEELCFQAEEQQIPLNYEYFINFLEKNIFDCSSRNGVKKLFSSITSYKQIGHEDLHTMTKEIGDDFNLDDILHILQTITDNDDAPSLDQEEFYYIMTKSPEQFEKYINLTKSLRKDPSL